jgi:hypothetical protein
MNTGAVIAPGLLATLAAFQPTLVTVQAHNGTRLANGDPSPSGWANVTGMVNIRATIYPDIKSTQQRGQEFTRSIDMRDCILNGMYPSIVPGNRVLVGAAVYWVITASRDSQGLATILQLERVL